MSTEATAAPAKGGKKGLLVWIVLALVAVAGGAVVPFLLGGRRHDNHAEKKKQETPKSKLAVVAFPDVVVNLGEDRLNRFLRAKIMVAVEETDLKEMTELLAGTQKHVLKSWLISYFSDQTTQEITRKVGVNRIRREIRNQFNATLFPDGEEKVVDILLDEFMVQ